MLRKTEEIHKLMNIEAPSGYKLFDHTADAGLTAWGSDPQGAFAEATRGMFAIVLGMGANPTEHAETQGTAGTLEVEVEGHDWPNLLVNWLAEFVFHFDVDGFVPQQIGFKECAPPHCEATVQGVYLEDPEQAGGVGIKAITYHQLEVSVTPERTELRVIFDI